jgi:hypothetical protein
MKARRLPFSIFILALLLLVMVVPVLAGAPPERAYCTETLLEVLKPGEMSMVGELVYITGIKEIYLEECDQPWASGKNLVTVNLVINPDGTGKFTGDFRLKTFEGGLWLGDFKGAFDAENSWYTARGVGYKIYDGYRIKVEALNGSGTTTRFVTGK